jgi:hypothetical protein
LFVFGIVEPIHFLSNLSIEERGGGIILIHKKELRIY